MRNCSRRAHAPRFPRSSPRRSRVAWHTTYRRSYGRACTGRGRGIAPRAEAARLPVSGWPSPPGGSRSTRACSSVEPRERSLAHAMLSCRHLLLVRDVDALSETAAERNILARRLVERDHEIVWGDLRGRHHGVVQGLQQAQPLLLRTACDERDLIIRILESEERARVTKLRRRQDMDDLKEIA